jgi:hypothetical protein
MLSVSHEERCEVLACFHVVVKMYRYSLEERVFIVKTYWITGAIKNCQRMFVEQFGGKQAPRISHDWLTTWAASSWFSLSYLIFLCCQLPFCEFPKHNRTSLQVWHAHVLHFCSFCKPTFSGATRKWDALCMCGQYCCQAHLDLLILLVSGQSSRWRNWMYLGAPIGQK